MQFFLDYRRVILRSLGLAILLIGLIIYFWEAPKKALSENDRAAARIARMEAKTNSITSKIKKSQEKDTSKFVEILKSTQAEQMKYMTVLAMLFGLGFLGHSFMPKKEEDS